jgi:hypothetical protein
MEPYSDQFIGAYFLINGPMGPDGTYAENPLDPE